MVSFLLLAPIALLTEGLVFTPEAMATMGIAGEPGAARQRPPTTGGCAHAGGWARLALWSTRLPGRTTLQMRGLVAPRRPLMCMRTLLHAPPPCLPGTPLQTPCWS